MTDNLDEAIEPIKVPKWWPKTLREWASEPVNNKKYAGFLRYSSLTIVTLLVMWLGHQCFAPGEFKTLRSVLFLPSVIFSVLLFRTQSGISSCKKLDFGNWPFMTVFFLSQGIWRLQKGRVVEACAMLFCILIVWAMAKWLSDDTGKEMSRQDV